MSRSGEGPELWSYQEIARHIGVRPETVRSYRRHGILPEPDMVDSAGRPRWYPDTVREWSRHRPGSRKM
ncbi:MerR family transcriptional regulator [Streptacidiphilus griseoplanus]|uniref:MerR family transcriptional regulator n=1 Tax=Peterkaempfera griseoplana TaxID=66896 RepID=UPI0006E1605F|nr:MerR family transcriptional regulator [Peterkaempfera griseoplana]